MLFILWLNLIICFLVASLYIYLGKHTYLRAACWVVSGITYSAALWYTSIPLMILWLLSTIFNTFYLKSLQGTDVLKAIEIKFPKELRKSQELMRIKVQDSDSTYKDLLYTGLQFIIGLFFCL